MSGGGDFASVFSAPFSAPLLLRNERGLHARAGHAALRAAAHLEKLPVGVVGDHVARDLALHALQARLVEELQLGAAVVELGALGPALDVVVGFVAALAEGDCARGDVELVAFRVFLHGDFRGRDAHRALRHDDVALEDTGARLVVGEELVGADVDLLLAIGTVRGRGERGGDSGGGGEDGSEKRAHSLFPRYFAAGGL